MDRTVIAPWKAEEKELSEKLYNKLHGLAVIYPLSEEFRKVMAWDMFLKPNQAAFFQVMHFLFRLLDAAEFKRRFFWPISDKRSEANFRASTVDYLKYLNEKHQLQWTNIKSYLVVMPGGMKFITFMLDFVSFVIQELIKQREKVLFGDSYMQSLKSLDVNTMHRQNMFLKEFASTYLTELEDQVNATSKRVQKLKSLLDDIAMAVGMTIDQLLNEELLLHFDIVNQNLYQEKLLNPAEKIFSLEQPTLDLKKKIEFLLTKETEEFCEKSSIRNALYNIKDVFPSECIKDEGVSELLLEMTAGFDDAVKINTLVQAFCSINDTIEEQLVVNDQRNYSNDFLKNELSAIKSEVENVESQLSDVQKELNAKPHQHIYNQKSSELTTLNENKIQPQRSVLQNPLMLKFVSTPTIKLKLGSMTRVSANLRLPLQDDFNMKTFESFNSMLAPVPTTSARKTQMSDEVSDVSITNKSKIMDSTQLLRTIHKDTAKSRRVSRQNLSALSLKWQQCQELAGTGVESLVPASPSSVSRPLDLPQSPYTPLNSNERTRVEIALRSSQCNGSGIVKLYTKRNSAVMKVLGSTMNVQNQSTSPSGRLDALIPDHIRFPKLQLNDVTIEDVRTCVDDSSTDSKNNLNILNTTNPQFAFDLSMNPDELSLNNISDSVLQDISM